MYRQGVILNTVMLTSLAAVVAGAIMRFAPTFQPAYMLLALALITVEAGIVHYAYRRDRMWLGELARYLAPELLVMVVLMRIVTTLSTGAMLGIEARRWIGDPFTVIDLPFLCAVVAAFAIGASTHVTMQALRDLLPQQFERATQTEETIRMMHVVAQDRATALGSISTRFVFGGMLVLAALSLEAVNITRIADPGQPISALSATGALCYLVSGFLLYSQGRLALLYARWRLDGAVVSPVIGKRWSRSSWLFIGGIGLVATLLPRTYGMGLLDTFRSTLGVISYFFIVLGYAVVWLFSLIAFLPALLLALLAGQPGPGTPPAFQAPPPLSSQPPPVAGEPNIIAAAIFWLCMAMLVLYALVAIAQRHPLLVEKMLRQGPLRRLWNWLRELWHDTSGWAALAASAVRQRFQQPLAPPPVRGPLLRLGALAPRELVRYFYRSTLRRAAQGGIPRRAGQTPNEYRETLAQALPDVEPDIAELTDAFVAAQYAPREVADEDAQHVRGPWQRLRARLRHREN